MIKRAFLYLLRKPAKTLVLLLVLIVIARFVTTGITILTSADSSTSDVRTSIGGSIKLELDYTNTSGASQFSSGGISASAATYTGDYIQDDLINKILSIDGVEDYNAIASVFAAFADFNYILGMLGFEYDYSDHMSSVAITNSENYKYFQSGTYKLVEGRHIAADDYNAVLVPSELVAYNGLSIGDVITLRADWNNGEKVELEIVGIYDRETNEDEFLITAYGYAGNRLITSMSVSNEIKDGSETGADPWAKGAEYVFFYVDGPANLEKISTEISKISNYFLISIDSADYDAIAGSLEALQSLMKILLVVIAVVSIAILALVLTIWIKSRVHEVGIFLSIGIHKLTIILQFVVEVAVVGIIAFALAFFVSTSIAQGVGDMLLEQAAVSGTEVVADDDDETFEWEDIAGDTIVMSSGEAASLEVSVSTESYILTIVIGLLIILASIVVSSIPIIRMKPKEIMSKMS